MSNKYDLVYADPAWQYRDKCKSGNRGVGFKYPTMNLKTIQAMPVGDICEKNAVLLMWVVMPQLKEGIETMEEWGFKYVNCCFAWIKISKSTGLPKMGMGAASTRGNTELCLMGRKGKGLKRLSSAVRQPILSVPGRHSEKPFEAYERIDALWGTDIKRVELFARARQPGWTAAWGNDVESDRIPELDDFFVARC